MADVRVGLVLLVLSVVHLPLSQSRAHHLQMHLNTKVSVLAFGFSNQTIARGFDNLPVR